MLRFLSFVSSIGKEEAEEEHGNSVKIEMTSITPVLHAFLFPDIISFQQVLHFGVGRSQIEWKLKVKADISVFPWANIGQNDHSNPYIESTTVLSDRRNFQVSENRSTEITKQCSPVAMVWFPENIDLDSLQEHERETI